MFVLLAREARVGVILRRGPSDWWHLTRWDTQRDQFEKGQWFHGRICPGKCDLSPDGKLFLYFGGKWRASARSRGYDNVWTAISRPPYLTALALWPTNSTWEGGGVFVDNLTVDLGVCIPKHHPKHPPGPLHIVVADPPVEVSWHIGWQAVPGEPRLGQYRKACGECALGRDTRLHLPSRSRTVYYLYRDAVDPIAWFEAHWADWDQCGRLVAAAGGRILTARLTKDDHLRWRQLTDLHDEKPTRLGTALVNAH